MSGVSAIPPTVAHSLTEAQLQQQVIDLASYYGWRHYHTLRAKGSDAGWPDLVLARPPELLVVELKAERGRLTDAQREWLQLLEMCGVEVKVWRPTSWPEIDARLRRRTDLPGGTPEPQLDEAAFERGGVAFVNADALEPYDRADGRWRPAVLAEAAIRAALNLPKAAPLNADGSAIVRSGSVPRGP